MNILLLSVGTRNKIIQFFKKSTHGKVVATDMQRTAPALYEADAYYIVPMINDPRYIDVILDICKKERIDAAMSLIDPELNLLACHKARFDEIGVRIVGSSYELCERALNKMQMFSWLQAHHYHCARSYDSLDSFVQAYQRGEVSFPVFVKPIYGSASLSTSKVNDMESLKFLFASKSGLMIQEFLDGQEIGADVYVDLISKQTVSIFTKKKLVMRAGETDKAVSFKDAELFELIERFIAESGWTGQIDIDMFDINGEYYISEVNPRFGGGYPHAYMCGCDHMKLIENNINGIVNERNIGCYEDGVYMMKYNELSVIKL